MDSYYCSNCGASLSSPVSSCPHCGAGFWGVSDYPGDQSHRQSIRSDYARSRGKNRNAGHRTATLAARIGLASVAIILSYIGLYALLDYLGVSYSRARAVAIPSSIPLVILGLRLWVHGRILRLHKETRALPFFQWRAVRRAYEVPDEDPGEKSIIRSTLSGGLCLLFGAVLLLLSVLPRGVLLWLHFWR